MTPEEEREIIATHKPFVLKHARRSASRFGLDIDDAVQDTYISLVRACRAWCVGDASVGTLAASFIDGANGNRLQALRRKKRKGVDLSMDAPLPVVKGRTILIDGNRRIGSPDDEPQATLHDRMGVPADQELRAIENERDARVRRALLTLDERSALIVYLRFYQERSLSDVARVLRLSRPWAKKLEGRALERLRARLALAGVSHADI